MRRSSWKGWCETGEPRSLSTAITALGGIKNFNVDAYAGAITCNAPVSHQCNQTPGWLALKDGKVVKEK